MIKPIDPKFGIAMLYSGGYRPGTSESPEPTLVKISTGERIPEDEPLILFRARDYNALRTLLYYQQLCAETECTDFHMEGIRNRIDAFSRFAAEHPERMKQPGITKGL